MFGWLRRDRTQLAEGQRKVLEALADYVPYSPPEWNSDTKSLHDASAEYRAFFFDNRELRVETFSRFIAKFSVAANFDEAGTRAVSAWCPLYADLLVDGLERDSVADTYYEFACPWTGTMIGLNVIFDLGIYIGECVLARNTKLKWLPSRGPEARILAHPIFGQKYHRPFDPIKWSYVLCRNICIAKRKIERRRRYPGTEFVSPDYLYGHVRAQAIL